MEQENSNTLLTSYVIGFVLSIILTFLAYVLVVNHILEGALLVAVIVGLAVIQLFVQLFFFLHLGKESKPRWNLIVFAFALSVVVIIVFGSLWIMNNLDYNMMHDMHNNTENIRDQGGF
jgi:cytochrome o ubiquinol oxidase operon protein cyoD